MKSILLLTLLAFAHLANAQLDKGFFGMHVHDAKHMPAQPPFGTIRLWDSGVAWYQLEPQQDQWNWEKLDARVAQAQQLGLDIILVLGQTPTWATTNPGDTLSPYCKGCNHSPKLLDDWADYVWTLALRYKGRIQYYEIWNEPNFNIFYNQAPEDMAMLARTAFNTIKSIDPKARVISPGIIANNWHWQNYDGPTWTRRYFGNTRGGYCHIAGMHFYTKDSTALEDELIPLIDTIKKELHRYNIHKPIWDTETGYGNAETANASKVQYMYGDSAAAYVARAHLIRWASGIARYCWYAWDNTSWVGLFMMGPDKKTATIGRAAYRKVFDLMVGAQLQDFYLKKGLYHLTYVRSQHTFHVLWQARGTAEFLLPAAWGSCRIHLPQGYTLEAKEQVVGVSSLPIWVETGIH